MDQKIYKSIGLMSGTSLDGIDLAYIESDGKNIILNKKFDYLKYNQEMKNELCNLIYNNPTKHDIKKIERDLTLLHADFVNNFLANNNIRNEEIDLLAFHGHTILHDPQENLTWQIGDRDLIEAKTKIETINNFRTFDVARGGQGAPLVPIYHFYLLSQYEKPTAILNIGGISNITFVASENEEDLQAFDICFGNAPIDDLVKEKISEPYDKNGEIALKGEIDYLLADRILQNDIFYKVPPKSFDRDDFKQIIAPVTNLNLSDALITLCYMHGMAIKRNIEDLQEKISQKLNILFVSGGGRKNKALMKMLKHCLDCDVQAIESAGYNGDSIEAEAFAYLAIRMKKKLAISYQKTTGILPDFDCAQVSFH